RLGVRRDGTLTAIETRFTRDHGAYPTLGDVIGLNTINHLAGPYRIPHFAGECVNVVTHKTFMGAYRGAGRPEAAFVLDRLLERAIVLGGDTALIGFGHGAIASRVAANAGPAIARSAREVGRRVRIVAAEALECAPGDVVLANGRAHVAGSPDRGVALGTLARRAPRSRGLAAEGAPGLHACLFFHPETVTWAFGAHACAVEVDVETGVVRLLRY